jgi:hypothetical protein
MAGQRKGVYEITNWSKYNESLVNRGSVTFWFDEDILADWMHANEETKNGRPFVYSDTAIECLLTLRELFRLPYRQTEGFARSLVTLMNAEIPIPDYTSLAKRASKLTIDLGVSNRKGPIDIVVDSTGLKVFGEGEWKMRTHGKSKRRTWRKLHLAVNPDTQEIEAEVLTENSGHDSDQVHELLEQIPNDIETFYGDGSYDKWKVYDELSTKGSDAIVPPQHNAKIKQHGNSTAPPLPRDEAIRRIRGVGRRKWKEEVGYHCRSLAETAMFRIKTIFGGVLKNRALPNQQTEARLRCKILNKFTQRGMPAFAWS